MGGWTSWPLCPDFVIELKSESDRGVDSGEKMQERISPGTRLGWLIDTDSRNVTIYRTGAEPETLICPAIVEGEGLVEGFTLDLIETWRNYDDC